MAVALVEYLEPALPRRTAVSPPEHRAPAVTRAIAVLKLLAASGEPMGVNAVARRVSIVPSTCLHVLRALADEGLVQADPATKRYSLGLGLLTLAHDMLGRNDFAQLAQPELDAIARRHGVTATAVELDGRERLVVVAMAQAQTFLRIEVGIGSRFPAFISATGRCVAARSGLSNTQLRPRFKALKWHSPPRFDDWLAQVARARVDGTAIDPGNYIAGFTIVAALVATPGPPRYAISVVCVSQQFTERGLDQVRRDAKACADRLAAQLQGATPRPSGVTPP